MFVTANQFYVFLCSVALGTASGVPYALFGLIKSRAKNRVVCAFVDAVYFMLITAFYVYASFMLGFPDFRLYMPIGFLLGLGLYLKSFYIILAKCGKMVYNKLKRKR